MISVQRLSFVLGLAVVETAPLALLVLLSGTGGIWGLLFVIVLVGVVADWAVQVWLPVERQRPALLVVALLLALWVIKARVAGDYGPLTGWDAALGALFSPRGGHPESGYVLLLVTLYCFWRGSRLLGHDRTSLRVFFNRATIALLIIAGFGFWLASPADAIVSSATMMVLIFFGAGLLAIALVGASDEDTPLGRLDWRGLLTLAGAITLVLIVGLVFVSLFGNSAVQALFTLWTVFVTLILLIMLPLILLAETIIHWLFSVFNIHIEPGLSPLREQQLQQQQQAAESLHVLPPWISALLQIVLALIPVLILAALFLLMRRRAHRPANSDEERESLWSWRGLGADLRSLFAGLRRGPDSGLRAALARLRGADPVSRIRRSYIRLLLLGEARERPRTPPQTPREYEPDADGLLPTSTQPIAALTGAYERARYHPASATHADADAAERAWSAIDRAEGRA